jgi:phosphonoacetaldehyde hydrolase
MSQPYRYSRVYAGPLRAVIFDWAGTMVDYGSRAPVLAFVEVFQRHGVTLSVEQARGPMGTAKPDHIRALLDLPAIQAQWRQLYRRAPGAADVEALYAAFLALEIELVAGYAELVPGAAEAAALCRARGLKIGSTTGYSRAIMEQIMPRARAQGYAPDCLVCPEDVPGGRPAPWMLYRCATQLGVFPMAACVKVGDTLADIEEGLNAGAWTVALSRSGNELGLSRPEADALDPADLAARLAAIGARLARAGAHIVAETVADLPAALDAIGERLSRGERP